MKFRRYGASRADVVVAIVILGVLRAFVWTFLSGYRAMHGKDMRARCSRNLASIGKAISVYAGDYDYMLPVAGGPGTQWGPGLASWTSKSRVEAFGLDPGGAGGQATIGSSLYLLVRYADLTPDSFVCPLEKRTRAFKPGQYGMGEKPLSDLWDFGPDPAQHSSYAYHMPYSLYRVTTSSEGNLVVAADRNPWIDGPRRKADKFSSFKPDTAPFNGTPEEARLGNSQVHRSPRPQQGGQNVLYLDGHVEFAKRAFCGLEDDNVYTSWDGRDRVRGVPPKPYQSQPADEHDSLLVNDPPLGR
jgi:prepilin-type processing-associated H-X9-DG protein